MAANQITVYLDPTQLPARTQDQATFDGLFALFMQLLPTFGAQFNTGIANFNAAAAGTAYALPYTVDLASTADTDPGNGKLRFNNATQASSTALFADLLAGGSDVTALLDGFPGSTSVIKGKLRLVKQADLTKWLTFDVMGVVASTGYRGLTVSNGTGSSANPFGTGDALLMFFQRTGDKGDKGDSGFSNMVVMRSTQTWTAPAGVVKAEFSVVDGGDGGPGSSVGYSRGAKTSISIRAVVPGTAYTCTVGGGGAGGLANGSPGNPGGASSVSASGFTTLTSAAGDLVIPGGAYGESYFGCTSAGNSIGAAGAGNGSGFSGLTGYAGAVIIKF